MGKDEERRDYSSGPNLAEILEPMQQGLRGSNNQEGAPAPAETTTSTKKKTSTEAAAMNEEDSASSDAQKKSM